MTTIKIETFSFETISEVAEYQLRASRGSNSAFFAALKYVEGGSEREKQGGKREGRKRGRRKREGRKREEGKRGGRKREGRKRRKV
jgi:hypothetical protein